MVQFYENRDTEKEKEEKLAVRGKSNEIIIKRNNNYPLNISAKFTECRKMIAEQEKGKTKLIPLKRRITNKMVVFRRQ